MFIVRMTRAPGAASIISLQNSVAAVTPAPGCAPEHGLARHSAPQEEAQVKEKMYRELP